MIEAEESNVRNMEVADSLTDALYELAKKDLKKARQEKGLANRVGLIIQSLRKAVKACPLCIWSQTPYFFTGKIYEPVEPSQFKGIIYDILERAKMEPAEFTQIEKIQRITLQAVTAKPLQIRKDIIVFENCVLTLGDLLAEDDPIFDVPVDPETGKRPWNVRRGRPKDNKIMHKHSPMLAQITMCHFDYNPAAKCRRWERFLEHVLPNAQMRMVLQEFIGCIFIDRKQAAFQSMLILLGSGANGKSVVSETVRGLVGSESMTSFGLDSLLVGTESLHNIAKMNGKRANWCTEIQAIQSGRFSDKLKSLIAGDPVECRQMYGLPFTATDIPVLMANCNALPPMQDKSYGMQRRFTIIRFDQTIAPDQQDKMLVQKLSQEYSGIFNWVLDGRQRYIDQNLQFTECKEIEAEVQAYMDTCTNVEEWLRIRTYRPQPESILEEEPLRIPFKSLYDDYSRWCIGNSLEPFGDKRVGAELTKLGFQKQRNAKGNCYKVYGEKALATLGRLKAKELARQLTENGGILNGQELKMGRVYDVGENSAAEHCHVSRPYLSIIRKAGYLSGLYTIDKRDIPNPATGRTQRMEVVIYDHKRLLQRLEAYGVYDENNGGKTLTERRREQVMRAKKFNEEMKRMGKPYRKLTGKVKCVNPKHGYLIVDPDWEYTPDNAEALHGLLEEIQNKMAAKEAGKVEVPYGFMKTKRQKIADAVVAELENDTTASDNMDATLVPVDEETGEMLTMDVDDDEFIVPSDEEE